MVFSARLISALRCGYSGHFLNMRSSDCYGGVYTFQRRHHRYFCHPAYSSTAMTSSSISYLSQHEAVAIDQQLFNEHGFSVDQLMELAGLSCAIAITREAVTHGAVNGSRVLIVCGPGNNGGDGLVCARHLCLFGFRPTVYYPKPKLSVDLYYRLVKQCRSFDIPVICDELPPNKEEEGGVDCGGGSERLVEYGGSLGAVSDYCMLVDALFGFSFRPPARSEYHRALRLLSFEACASSVPVCSIDVPSGWHVETGPGSLETELTIEPQVLISLTAPKLCAKRFTGVHYLGGRFVPECLRAKYNIKLPAYPTTDCIVKLA